MKTSHRLDKNICKTQILKSDPYAKYKKNSWNSILKKKKSNLKTCKRAEQITRENTHNANKHDIQ
jgi:hypothetical protein